MPLMRFSIRAKLTIGALLPLFVAIMVCSLIGIYIINSRIVSQAQEKVRIDLNSAREVYLNEIVHIRDVVRFTANAPRTALAVSSNDRAAIVPILSALRVNEQLDILTAVDAKGRVLFRARNPAVFGDDRSADQLVARALQGRSDRRDRTVSSGGTCKGRGGAGATGDDQGSAYAPGQAERQAGGAVRHAAGVVGAGQERGGGDSRRAVRRRPPERQQRPGGQDQEDRLRRGPVPGGRCRHGHDLSGRPPDNHQRPDQGGAEGDRDQAVGGGLQQGHRQQREMGWTGPSW